MVWPPGGEKREGKEGGGERGGGGRREGGGEEHITPGIPANPHKVHYRVPVVASQLAYSRPLDPGNYNTLQRHLTSNPVRVSRPG